MKEVGQMRVIDVRRLAYSMQGEWRAFQPLYEGVAFAVVGAFEAGLCSLPVLHHWKFWLSVDLHFWLDVAFLAGSVSVMGHGLLEVRRFVRRVHQAITLRDQIRRDDQRARYDRYTGQRLDGDHDHDRDYSRGRGRER
jgi:hypothetical protein